MSAGRTSQYWLSNFILEDIIADGIQLEILRLESVEMGKDIPK